MYLQYGLCGLYSCGVNLMLMLTLDDAVRVAKRLAHFGIEDKEFIRQELEQECWFSPETDDAAKTLSDLICNINPAEICAQIEVDNLRRWCEKMQVIMNMAMVELPCWGERGTDERSDKQADGD